MEFYGNSYFKDCTNLEVNELYEMKLLRGMVHVFLCPPRM